MRFIDLSQTIQPNMPLFSPSAPAPQLRLWQSHADAARSGRYVDCTCAMHEIQFVTSIGTYMDSPYHFDPQGSTIEQLTLEQTILPAVVIDCSNVTARQPVEPAVLDGVTVRGKAVLFRTDWSRFWGQSEYYEFPFF